VIIGSKLLYILSRIVFLYLSFSPSYSSGPGSIALLCFVVIGGPIQGVGDALIFLDSRLMGRLRDRNSQSSAGGGSTHDNEFSSPGSIGLITDESESGDNSSSLNRARSRHMYPGAITPKGPRSNDTAVAGYSSISGKSEDGFFERSYHDNDNDYDDVVVDIAFSESVHGIDHSETNDYDEGETDVIQKYQKSTSENMSQQHDAISPLNDNGIEDKNFRKLEVNEKFQNNSSVLHSSGEQYNPLLSSNL